MKSFKETIGGSAAQISEARVQRTVQNTAEYSSKYIDDLKHNFRDLQSKIEDHMDIAPTNTTLQILHQIFVTLMRSSGLMIFIQ